MNSSSLSSFRTLGLLVVVVLLGALLLGPQDAAAGDKKKKKIDIEIEDDEKAHLCRLRDTLSKKGKVTRSDMYLVPRDDEDLDGDDPWHELVSAAYYVTFNIDFDNYIPAGWRLYDPYHGRFRDGFQGFLCGELDEDSEGYVYVDFMDQCPLENKKDFSMKISIREGYARYWNPSRLEIFGVQPNGTEFIGLCLQLEFPLDTPLRHHSLII